MRRRDFIEEIMADLKLTNMPDEDPSTSEDRFGRYDDSQYSEWSSAIVIIATVIVIGTVFAYLVVH